MSNVLHGNKYKKGSLVAKAARELKKNKILYMMILPGVLFALIFSYIPMGGVIIAFQNYNFKKGILGSDWVGLNNFKVFFASGKMWLLTKNTIVYNLIFIVTGTVFNIVLAILISEMCTRKYKRVLQSIMMFPHFLSWVIVGGIAYNIFNYEFGLLNSLLTSWGFDRVDVYSNTSIWKIILPIVNIWKESGYSMIFYLAAITGISPELYEAARVDGCGIIKKIRYIILPLLRPTICILLLMSLSGILKGNMEMFYQLVGANSYLYNATDVLDTYVYRTLMQLKNYGITSATGLYQSIVGFVLVITVNCITKRLDPDSAIF